MFLLSFLLVGKKISGNRPYVVALLTNRYYLSVVSFSLKFYSLEIRHISPRTSWVVGLDLPIQSGEN